MNHRSSTCWLCVVAASAVLVVAMTDSGFGSPARRLARRGVIVAPPGVVAVPVPLPAPAGTAPRAWRRLGMPPGVVIVPAVPGFATGGATSLASPGAVGVQTSAAAPRVASATPPVPSPGATAATDATADVEVIPAPLPVPTDAAGSLSSGATQVFTPEWFVRHQDAWQPSRPPIGPWKMADAASLAAWLGQPVVAAGGAAGGAQVAQAGAVEADGLRSVLVLQSGHGPEAAGADWLPLGVFAVTQPGGTVAANYQQLAVDRSGTIRGNFYDAVSDTVLPISGAVDRQTLRASWVIGANGSRFEADIASLSTPPRTVTVSSNGGSRAMQLAPIDLP